MTALDYALALTREIAANELSISVGTETREREEPLGNGESPEGPEPAPAT